MRGTRGWRPRERLQPYAGVSRSRDIGLLFPSFPFKAGISPKPQPDNAGYTCIKEFPTPFFLTDLDFSPPRLPVRNQHSCPAGPFHGGKTEILPVVRLRVGRNRRESARKREVIYCVAQTGFTNRQSHRFAPNVRAGFPFRFRRNDPITRGPARYGFPGEPRATGNRVYNSHIMGLYAIRQTAPSRSRWTGSRRRRGGASGDRRA